MTAANKIDLFRIKFWRDVEVSGLNAGTEITRISELFWDSPPYLNLSHALSDFTIRFHKC